MQLVGSEMSEEIDGLLESLRMVIEGASVANAGKPDKSETPLAQASCGGRVDAFLEK